MWHLPHREHLFGHIRHIIKILHLLNNAKISNYWYIHYEEFIMHEADIIFHFRFKFVMIYNINKKFMDGSTHSTKIKKFSATTIDDNLKWNK